MEISSRAAAVSPSVTLALDARAKALAAGGEDVVNMSVGEPDFDAPRLARECAARRALEGPVRYTPAAGTHELRAALARHLADTRGVEYAPEDVVVCHSTKHALTNAALAVVDPGDEVLLILPAWNSYTEIVRIAGGVPVEVAPRADLGPDLDAIRAAVGERTRAILLNSPSNPSGYVWSAGEVRALAELAEERDLWILSDEIYRRLVYEGAPNASPVEVHPGARARTIVLDGASKVFAMTGYRIGFAAGPRQLVGAIAALQSQMTGSPNAVSQAAYLAALQAPGGEPPEVAEMAAEFARRRDLLLAGLERLGLRTPPPRGAFYAFPDVSRHLDERGSVGFCEDLLESERLALVPGAAFGLDAHVRLSYATSQASIARALERLGRFLSSR